MAQALIDRLPTKLEVERLRLVLSTYQDGTGQYPAGGSLTLPGWRDFERAVALAFGGVAQESKAAFDVLLPSESRAGISYGLSCKMRRELDKVEKAGRLSLELTNSAGEFWDRLMKKGINQSNYRERPAEVGETLVEVVDARHRARSVEQGGEVNIAGSSYLVLSWNRAGWYQLHQLPLAMPDPRSLTWHFPEKKGGGEGRRLAGNDGTGTLFEWYGESGAQLKYYPLANTAKWVSEKFQLEPLPDIEYGILNKTAAYFPDKWVEACGE